MIPAELRSEKEKTRFAVAAVFASIFWGVMLIGIVGAAIAGGIKAMLPIVLMMFVSVSFVMVAHGLFMARLRGNGVRLGPNQLPHLWNKVTEAARRLNLPEPPETIVIQAGGVLNAFATKVFSRRFVVLFSDLLEAAEAAGGGPDAPEVDFLIGHEVGHLAAGHLGARWFVAPAMIIPLLGAAYSRACEYTADACGHLMAGKLEASSRALAILAAGGRNAARINFDSWMQQNDDTISFMMSISELNSTHPFTPKRIAALRARTSPDEALRTIGHHPLAYPLAPVLAPLTGGAASSFAIFFVIILMSVAMPAFRQYVAQSRMNQMRGSQSLEEVMRQLERQEAARSAAALPSEEAEEAREFTVVLNAAGRNKISVIKAVREATGLGLKDAKGLVEAAPTPIKGGLSREAAEDLQVKLVEAGAVADIE